MHSFIIRAIGSPQETWQTEAINLYLTRLKPFAKVKYLEFSESRQGSANPDLQKLRTEEAKTLLYSLSPSDTVILLDEQGVNYDSPTFSKKLESWSDGGQTLTFLLGGSWGVHEKVTKRANYILSLGKQTLPHILARIVFLEQLYRAETILHRKVYHK